ncbi:MAG: class I SAM-dependent methyltransferase [Gemmataceae bacterium]
MNTAAPTPYDAAFYADQSDGSLRSARAVAPLVVELVQPRSVLDVGCGVGTWLRAFHELGVENILGIDGDYVDRSKLAIDRECFRAVDLSNPPDLGRSFDLAVCLEVGEHLPEKSSAKLVRLLTRSAPAVLFSAAAPGQGGTHHVNERWPHFWRELFRADGFVRLDPIRPRIWRDNRVEWWYQQNIYLFIRESEVAERPALREEFELARRFPFELVHEGVLSPCVRAATFGGAVKALPRLAMQALRRRLS